MIASAGDSSRWTGSVQELSSMQGMSMDESLEKVNDLLIGLEAAASQLDPTATLATLTPEHGIHLLLKQITPLITHSLTIPQHTQTIAQLIFKKLFETDKVILQQIYLAILQR